MLLGCFQTWLLCNWRKKTLWKQMLENPFFTRPFGGDTIFCCPVRIRYFSTDRILWLCRDIECFVVTPWKTCALFYLIIRWINIDFVCGWFNRIVILIIWISKCLISSWSRIFTTSKRVICIYQFTEASFDISVKFKIDNMFPWQTINTWQHSLVQTHSVYQHWLSQSSCFH